MEVSGKHHRPTSTSLEVVLKGNFMPGIEPQTSSPCCYISVYFLQLNLAKAFPSLPRILITGQHILSRTLARSSLNYCIANCPLRCSALAIPKLHQFLHKTRRWEGRKAPGLAMWLVGRPGLGTVTGILRRI
jgi:hypothetical protein